MVSEVPGPYAEVTKGFTNEGLASQKMKLVSREDIKLGSHKGILLKVSQEAYGQVFFKWIVVLGDSAESALVVASFPQMYEKELSVALKKTVLSATWDQSAKVSLSEGLTFSVDPAGEFKAARTIGNTLLLTSGGVFPLKSLDDPLVVVGSSASENLKISDPIGFSRKRLMQTKSLREIKLISESDININSLPGRRIYATAFDKNTANERFVYHALLIAEHGYFLFQGICDSSKKEKYIPLFEAMLKSFKRKK